jgi:hypothetical protein
VIRHTPCYDEFGDNLHLGFDNSMGVPIELALRGKFWGLLGESDINQLLQIDHLLTGKA